MIHRAPSNSTFTIINRTLAWAVAVTLGLATLAPAATITATGNVGDSLDEAKPVSASADFSLNGDILKIVLTNTASGSDYTPAQVLTDVSFNVDGDVVFDVTDGDSKVLVAAGSTLYNGTSATTITDISAEWGLATDVTLPAADFSDDITITREFSFTSASLGGANDNRFDSGEVGGPSKLAGGDFGLINDESKFNHTNGANAYTVVDAVEIFVKVSGLSDLSQITDVSFSYGSAHKTLTTTPPPPTNVIPAPAALPAGLAMLLALSLPKRGVLTLRRRR